MSETKNDLVVCASQQVAEYLETKYCIDVDYLDIAEIINLTMREVLNSILKENHEPENNA